MKAGLWNKNWHENRLSRKGVDMHGDVLRMVAVSFAEDIDAAYMNGVFFNGDFKRNIRAVLM